MASPETSHEVTLTEVRAPTDSKSKLLHLSINLRCVSAATKAEDPQFALEIENHGSEAIVVASPLSAMRMTFFDGAGRRVKPPLSAYMPDSGAYTIDIVPAPVHSVTKIPDAIPIPPGGKFGLIFVCNDRMKRSIRSLVKAKSKIHGAVKCRILFSIYEAGVADSSRMIESDFIEMPTLAE
jgi:hypothetical protein